MLRKPAQRVQEALNGLGFSCQVLELPETTRTASEAAQTIGCRVEQIVNVLTPEIPLVPRISIFF